MLQSSVSLTGELLPVLTVPLSEVSFLDIPDLLWADVTDEDRLEAFGWREPETALEAMDATTTAQLTPGYERLLNAETEHECCGWIYETLADAFRRAEGFEIGELYPVVLFSWPDED